MTSFQISPTTISSNLWGDRTSDFTIIHGDERIPVHEKVLVLWSDVFRGWFKHGMTESQTREVDLSDHPYSTDSLVTFLKLLYCKEVDINKDNVIMVYRWAHYFDLDAVMDPCTELLIPQIMLKSKELRRTFFQTVSNNNDHDLLARVRGEKSSQPLADSIQAFLLNISDQLQDSSYLFTNGRSNICFNRSSSSNSSVMDDGKVFVSMTSENKYNYIYNTQSPDSENVLHAKFIFDMIRGNMTMVFTNNLQSTAIRQPRPKKVAANPHPPSTYSAPSAPSTTSTPARRRTSLNITLCSFGYPDSTREGYMACSEGDIIAIDIVPGELTVTNQRTKQKETQSWTSSKTASFTLNGRVVLRILD
ncbi:hypothetical protein P9112_010521 [Eukaryota sp. TZLM1-RC]